VVNDQVLQRIDDFSVYMRGNAAFACVGTRRTSLQNHQLLISEDHVRRLLDVNEMGSGEIFVMSMRNIMSDCQKLDKCFDNVAIISIGVVRNFIDVKNSQGLNKVAYNKSFFRRSFFGFDTHEKWLEKRFWIFPNYHGYHCTALVLDTQTYTVYQSDSLVSYNTKTGSYPGRSSRYDLLFFVVVVYYAHRCLFEGSPNLHKRMMEMFHKIRKSQIDLDAEEDDDEEGTTVVLDDSRFPDIASDVFGKILAGKTFRKHYVKSNRQQGMTCMYFKILNSLGTVFQVSHGMPQNSLGPVVDQTAVLEFKARILSIWNGKNHSILPERFVDYIQNSMTD